jgi:tetratricopeptide (TPR) repeat protein
MSSQTGRQSRSSLFGLALAAALVAVSLTACGSKTDAQLANDALQSGLEAQAAGQLDRAATAYNDCLKHEPKNKVCLYDLGTVEQAQDHAVAAEADYRLALAIDPKYAPALFNLAIIRADAGSFDEAIGLYRQYLTLTPKSAAGHFNLGLLLNRTGASAEGKTEIAAALALDPTLRSRLPSSPPSASPSPSAP